ncbi:hypothetical protein ACFSL4_13185 [Streptomyces caeni]|uniref:Uncharacterized protein n=1 Tax=Streptomyces caeni TaxID=2307231 RepID=A0ABW4IRE3_9ACTN
MPIPSKRIKDDVDGTADHHAAQQRRRPALAQTSHSDVISGRRRSEIA